MRKATFALAAATTAALVLAGCASGGQQSGSSAAKKEGPLDAYMDAIFASQQWNEEKEAERAREREELAAKCMADQGFQYIPNPGGSGFMGSASDENGIDTQSLEFAKEYGFGIVDFPGDVQGPAIDDLTLEDPNAEYVESLSDSEQEAYWEALYGPGPDDDQMAQMEAGELDWEPDNFGCMGQASEATDDGAFNIFEDPEFQDLMDSMNEVYSKLQSSPEVQELNHDWAACIADAGYPDIENPDALAGWAYQQYSDLLEANNWEPLSEADQEDFKKVEIKAAVANYDCNKKINYQKRYDEADVKYQQEFVDAHKDQLDAAVAKYGVK